MDQDAEFERMGAENVRLRLHTSQLPGGWAEPAIKWLAAQDRAERSRIEASQDLQSRIALSAERAAWIAAKVAIIAAVFAMISIVIGVLAWLYPRTG